MAIENTSDACVSDGQICLKEHAMETTHQQDTTKLPRNIVLEVTPHCNNDCLYCYNVWRYPGSDYPTGRLSTEQIFKVIDNLLEDLDIEIVTLSGGEPFTRPDLWKIVSYLWSRHIHVVVVTNGTLLTKENIEMTSGTYNYELPLLSYRSEVHDYLSGAKSFRKVLEGMHNLQEMERDFVVAFIATKVNYQHLERAMELAIVLGAKAILYNRMNVSVNNMRHLDELLPTLDMVRENLETLERMAVKYGIPISSSIPIQPCLIDMKAYPHVYHSFCPLAGKNDPREAYFTVDPLGNLRVCNHSSVILGNLLEQRFVELIKHPIVGQYRELIPAECVACPEAIRDYCHGGCKAAAEVCYHSLEACEPFLQCNLQYRTIPELLA